jgi:hypothetical protein
MKELPAHEAVASELPSPKDTEETPWVPASEILSRLVDQPSRREITAPVETMSPGSIGVGFVSPLSLAGWQGRTVFFPRDEDSKRHNTYYNP